MQTTNCRTCFKEISYNEEESLEGKPEFCSASCSRKAFHNGDFDQEDGY
jgi:hypothetical protein